MNEQAPTQDGYGGATRNFPEIVENLPFTGFDLWMLAVAGVLLVALGFTMRRRSRRRASTPDFGEIVFDEGDELAPGGRTIIRRRKP